MTGDQAQLRKNVLGFFQDYYGLEQYGRLTDQIGVPADGLTLRQKGGVFIVAGVKELFQVAPSDHDYAKIIALASGHAAREAREGGDGTWELIRDAVARNGTAYGLVGDGDSLWHTWSPQQRKNFDGFMQEELSKRKQGGCYLATAVYGSYDCPEVWVLRRFRDETLMQTKVGRSFVRTYYTLSPLAVRVGGAGLKAIVKLPLERFVNALRLKGVSDAPYSD